MLSRKNSNICQSTSFGLLLTLLLSVPTGAWAAEAAPLRPAQQISPEQVAQVHAAPETPPEAPATPEQTAKIEYNKGVELFQIAQIQSEKGNQSGQKALLKEAIKHFETALKSNPKLVEAQSNIGFAWLTIHDYRKAIAAFEKALLINPNHLNTLNGLSTAYAFSGNINKATETFNRLTTLDPNNSQYFFNKGSVLQKANRIPEAQAAYEQALKINPNDQRALFNMGTLLENQGKLAEARPYYEKAKGVEISNPIGLEAVRRIEAIDASLKSTPQTGQ